MSASLLELAIQRHGPEYVHSKLTDEQRARLRYEWKLWARPEQLPPDGDWLTWLLLAGRGFGKSRTGAEWVREQAKLFPGSHGALIGPTAADVRDVMVKTLLGCSSPADGVAYEPSKRCIAWKNGSSATLYSAEEPDRLRGPQHAWAWVDEIAAFQYPEELWDMLMMTMRQGERPRVVVSTTPRPIEIIRRLIKDPGTVATRGSTFDNSANLPGAFLHAVRDRYAGTRLGRQELYAEILDDIEGALWKHELIDAARVRVAPQFARVVVAVDPSGSAKKTADEAGIIVAALGVDGHGYVIEDLSGRYSPRDMAQTACDAYHRHSADRLVAEDNFGGQIVADLISLTDRRVAYRAVHASRGKIVRAEPVAALYEQGRVHHVGMFTHLEDELCNYTVESTESPGRMDALVWAFTELMLNVSKPVQRGVFKVHGSF